MSTKAIMEEQKDVGVNLRKRGYGVIKDYKNSKGVTVSWGDIDQDARKGGLFKLKVGRTEVILSKHDLQYLLRNV